MSEFNVWPEIFSGVGGMVFTGVVNYIQTRSKVPMGAVSTARTFTPCSIQGCLEEAAGFDANTQLALCEGHCRALEEKQLAERQQQKAQPRARVAPVQSSRQSQSSRYIDPHDAETVRSRREIVQPGRQSHRPDYGTVRDWREEVEEYEDDDYLDDDEFYEEEEDLCPHGADPARCRRCYESMQRAFAQQQQRRQAQPQYDDRCVNRGARQLPRRRRS